jgi:hypothetical protein
MKQKALMAEIAVAACILIGAAAPVALAIMDYAQDQASEPFIYPGPSFFSGNRVLVVPEVVAMVSLSYAIAVRIFRPVSRRAVASAAECLDLILKDTPAAKSDGCRKLLDACETILNEARQARSVKAQEEKLDQALGAYQEYLVSVQRKKVERLDEGAKKALTANNSGEGSYPIPALKTMQDLIALVKRELDRTKPDSGAFILSAEEGLKRTEQPLTEAAAIAEAIGLPGLSPLQERSGQLSDGALLSKTAKLLEKARRHVSN